MFGKEFPQKKMWRNVFSDILLKIQFLCKMAKCTTLFVCRLILFQNFLYIAHGFPEIIPFPVQLPIKLIERNLQNSVCFLYPSAMSGKTKIFFRGEFAKGHY